MKYVTVRVVAFLFLIGCCAFPTLTIEMMDTYLKHESPAQRWRAVWKLDEESLQHMETLLTIYDETVQHMAHLIRIAKPALKEVEQGQKTSLLINFNEQYEAYQASEKEFKNTIYKVRVALGEKTRAIDARLLTPKQSSLIYAMFYIPFIFACAICGWFSYHCALRTQNDFWRQKEQSYSQKVRQAQEALRAEQQRLESRELNLDKEIDQRVTEGVTARTTHLEMEQRQLLETREQILCERKDLLKEAEALRTLHSRIEKDRQEAARDRDHATQALQEADRIEKRAAEWGRRIEAGVAYLQEKLATLVEETKLSMEKIMPALTEALQTAQNVPQR